MTMNAGLKMTTSVGSQYDSKNGLHTITEVLGGSWNFGKTPIVRENVNGHKKGTFDKFGGSWYFRPNVNDPEKLY